MYIEPEMLILDEATSSLDSASEQYVQKTVHLFREQKKTVIIIAHRLSTVFNADKIIVLEKGRLVEEGSHTALMGNKITIIICGSNSFPCWKKRKVCSHEPTVMA